MMAEGEGFEPPVRFPVQWFSRPPVSTAHASLRAGLNSILPATWEVTKFSAVATGVSGNFVTQPQTGLAGFAACVFCK
jgi:hypothetical protein